MEYVTPQYSAKKNIKMFQGIYYQAFRIIFYQTIKQGDARKRQNLPNVLKADETVKNLYPQSDIQREKLISKLVQDKLYHPPSQFPSNSTIDII